MCINQFTNFHSIPFHFMHACTHACIHSCPFMHVHSYITMRTMRIYCLIFNYLFWPVWLSCSLQSPSWFVDDAFERQIKHTKLILWHDSFFPNVSTENVIFCSLIPTSHLWLAFLIAPSSVEPSSACQVDIDSQYRNDMDLFLAGPQTQTPRVFLPKSSMIFPDSGFLLSFFSAERQGSGLVNLRLF